MKRRYAIIGFALSLAVIVCVVYARSVASPPDIKDIADTWIGYTSDDLNLYRLTLHEDGTGLCAFSFVREPAILYEVSGWRLNRYAIEVVLVPVDSSAEPIRMTGKTAGWHLNLTVEGSGWSRGLKMYRETEVQAAVSRVKTRMERHSVSSTED